MHRDLKPANIMVDKQGEPIIMDFGLARKARKEGEATLTQSGAILGSPAYMSPEQIEGDAESVGPASDQYSLGVVLYEMLTGQLPFRGSMVNVLAQIITKGPTRPSELRPGLDPRIEAVCLKMMSKKASDRFPSMKAVAEELAVIVKSPAPATTNTVPTAPEKSPTASRPPAAATPTGDAGRASQIRKPVKEKALTESDVTSLEELVRKCARRRDYDQMIQIIERVPENRRSEALQTLLEKAREKLDEISFLICEIDEADRLNDGRTALKKAEELLKIKPGHRRAREVQEKYSGYGDEGAARIGLVAQFTKPWNEGGWIPWSVLAFGLAVFAVMCGVIVIYLNRTAIAVDVKDPGVEVAVKGTTLTVTGPDKQSVKVEAGEQLLTITGAGFETTTRSFSLKKGDKKTVTVSIVNKEIVARLENEILPATPVDGEKPSNSSKLGETETSTEQSREQKQGGPVHARYPEADRRAAEWVLSIGGAIRINENGGERDLNPGAELPSEAFELTDVRLSGNFKATDTGLALFKGCKNLTALDLSNTKVSDAGLSNFKDCKNLTRLILCVTQVGDAGLACFNECKNLTSLDLGGTQVSDVGLAAFRDCKNLTSLALGGATKVGDRGLAYFKGCTTVKVLHLWDTQVTDAGLANFRDCNNLESLALGFTHVSDAGLALFKDCKYLRTIALNSTQVGDAGLAYFEDCKNLTDLNLSGTNVTDSGAAYLKGFKNLTSLGLGGTKVSDAGLAYFNGCKNLTSLDLGHTEVSNAGLEQLAAFRHLASLFVKKTNVTETGVKQLAAALPRCKIEWDGGVIEAKADGATTNAPSADGILNSSTDPDRRAAEWVLSIGGTIKINENGSERDIKSGGDLPRGAFELIVADLGRNAKVTDSGLACFNECKNLTTLRLGSTQVTNSGVANFKDCKNLTDLDLNYTKVGDAGLSYFKDCRHLTSLWLIGTEVTDAGLANFKSCKNLVYLGLAYSQVTDAGLTYFKNCKNLKGLDLSGTKVVDVGLTYFKDCKNLISVRLLSSKVSDAGLAHLKDYKSLSILELGDTKVTDAGLAHFKNYKSFMELFLGGTQVSDAGLAYIKNSKNLMSIRLDDTEVTDAGLQRLAGFRNLNSVSVKKTNVSEAGVKKLAAARPRCKIEWDGGVIGPR